MRWQSLYVRIHAWSIVLSNTLFPFFGNAQETFFWRDATPRGSSWPVCSKGSYSPDYRHNLAITESGSGNRSGYDFKAGEWWNAPNRARDSFEKKSNRCVSTWLCRLLSKNFWRGAITRCKYIKSRFIVDSDSRVILRVYYHTIAPIFFSISPCWFLSKL